MDDINPLDFTLKEVPLAWIVLGGLLLLVIGYLARKFLVGRKVERAESLAKKIVADAEKKAGERKREVSLEAKEELYRARSKFEEETEHFSTNPIPSCHGRRAFFCSSVVLRDATDRSMERCAFSKLYSMILNPITSYLIICFTS